MNGYLNYLAAHGLGLTQVILPRLASRFEPLSFGGRPIMGAREADNGKASSSPLFDDSWPAAESTESETLNSRRAFGASKQRIGDIQVESNPIPGKLAPQQPDEITSALIPKDRPLIRHETCRVKTSFPSRYFSTKQPIDTDPSAKTLGLNHLDQPISKPSNLHTVIEQVSPVDSSEPLNSREVMSGEGIRFKSSIKSETKPSLRQAKKSAEIEKEVSGPQFVVAINEKNAQSKSMGEEVKRSNIESPIQIIEIERISEAKSKMPVRYLSEPSSIKITQPSTPSMIPSETHHKKYLLQSETKLIGSRSRRKPEPAIQVTIGSIEVKAALPSMRAKSERRAPPMMSLKEYLQRRGGSK